MEKSHQECYIKRGCDGLARHPLALKSSNENQLMHWMRLARRRRKSRKHDRHGLHDGSGKAKENDGWVLKAICG